MFVYDPTVKEVDPPGAPAPSKAAESDSPSPSREAGSSASDGTTTSEAIKLVAIVREVALLCALVAAAMMIA